MNMFQKNTIRKRVLAAVEQKIADAQTAFDSECNTIDERAATQISKIHDNAAQEKETLLNNAVESIIGK